MRAGPTRTTTMWGATRRGAGAGVYVILRRRAGWCGWGRFIGGLFVTLTCARAFLSPRHHTYTHATHAAGSRWWGPPRAAAAAGTTTWWPASSSGRGDKMKMKGSGVLLLFLLLRASPTRSRSHLTLLPHPIKGRARGRGAAGAAPGGQRGHADHHHVPQRLRGRRRALPVGVLGAFLFGVRCLPVFLLFYRPAHRAPHHHPCPALACPCPLPIPPSSSFSWLLSSKIQTTTHKTGRWTIPPTRPSCGTSPGGKWRFWCLDVLVYIVCIWMNGGWILWVRVPCLPARHPPTDFNACMPHTRTQITRVVPRELEAGVPQGEAVRVLSLYHILYVCV